MLTNNQLLKIYPFSTETNRQKFLPHFNRFMPQYGINSAIREAAFLAQIGHESGQLFYTEEIASGKAYEGRRNLGNIVKGDGMRFKGRGLIQITGRSNYSQLSKAFDVDFVQHPKLLKDAQYAVQSACWWWQNRGLNELADNTSEQSFRKITRIINGGYNGYESRYRLWCAAKKVLNSTTMTND